jgi:hypothetical protein
MTKWYAPPQFCSLGPPPPRTPARPDPQVPRVPDAGPSRWGKIGAFYFFIQGTKDEPAFGFFDMEISLQLLAGEKVRFELYAIADGYQQCGAFGEEHPVNISLTRQGKLIADIRWIFPDLPDGAADPVSFDFDIAIGKEDWLSVDCVKLDAREG